MGAENTAEFRIETRGFAFVTNPGDEGHVDHSAPPDVQARQRARRRELVEAFVARSLAEEEEGRRFDG